MNVLESKTILPASLAAFFAEPGYCESTFFESRKNSRLRIRCKAAISIEASPPSIPRSERQFIVYVKDISKRGIGIVSHIQIFPAEELLICFQHREVRATAVRCRRIGDFCWECGAQITSFKNLEEDNEYNT